MITKERLDAIRKLCEEATPGPWEASEKSYYYEYYQVIARSTGEEMGSPDAEGDAKFIAASRQIIPELLEEIGRCQQSEQAHKNMHISNSKRLNEENLKLRAVAEAAEKIRFREEFDCTYVEANDWVRFREALKAWRGEG